MKRLAMLILLILVTVSCSKKQGAVSDKNNVTIGTFNLEWLGDGERDHIDRSEEDYRQIANIIKDTGADVLAIQEVENPKAIKRVLKYLDGYSFFLSKGAGSQNVGVLFKNDVKIDYLGDYTPVAIEEGRNRPGMILSAKKGNFDWIMMVVHLKSTSHYDVAGNKLEKSRNTREEQSEIIAHWADSVISSGREKDIIIAGDFNDTPKRKKNNTLLPLLNDPSLNFLTSELRSCKFKSMYVIDQVIASSSAMKRYNSNSAEVYDFFSSMSKQQTEHVSDHCPVLVRFEVTSKDND